MINRKLTVRTIRTVSFYDESVYVSLRFKLQELETYLYSISMLSKTISSRLSQARNLLCTNYHYACTCLINLI